MNTIASCLGNIFLITGPLGGLHWPLVYLSHKWPVIWGFCDLLVALKSCWTISGVASKLYAMMLMWYHYNVLPISKVHGANMGLTWVLSAPDGPHVGPMNHAIWALSIVPHGRDTLCHISHNSLPTHTLWNMHWDNSAHPSDYTYMNNLWIMVWLWHWMKRLSC